MPPLQQLNLKLSDSVLDHWRREAAAAGLSVRDWLVSVTIPATPDALPLAARLAAVEADLARLSAAVEKIQRRPAAALDSSPRRRSEPSPPAEQDQERLPVSFLSEGEIPGDAVPSSVLARILGVSKQTILNRMDMQGGPRVGLVLSGWRCVGRFRPEGTGGHASLYWVPADASPGT